MNAGEDVGSGSDGSSEGGEEWLHSVYNISPLDLLMDWIWIIRERHQDNYVVGPSTRKDWVGNTMGVTGLKKSVWRVIIFFLPSFCQIVNEHLFYTKPSAWLWELNGEWVKYSCHHKQSKSRKLGVYNSVQYTLLWLEEGPYGQNEGKGERKVSMILCFYYTPGSVWAALSHLVLFSPLSTSVK